MNGVLSDQDRYDLFRVLPALLAAYPKHRPVGGREIHLSKPGASAPIGHCQNRNQKRLNFWSLEPHHSISRASVAATFGSNIAVLGKADAHAFYNLFTKCRYERGNQRCCNDKE